ncbi:MAG TPA: hypothetical protein VHT00_14185 [Stellaceae bacterium]|nr:hypothetical protein [Stellaceae bacterium]
MLTNDWYRGNRTPHDRLRVREENVAQLESRLAQARVELAEAQREALAFDRFHNPPNQEQVLGGLGCGLGSLF